MMAPHRQYTTADFAHIAATEFADYGFHLTQKWQHCKHITQQHYRDAYILWAMRRFGDVDVAREFLDFAMPDMFDPVCDIKTAWDKLERLMPDLHDYRPVTDEEKQKWYNI